MRQSEFFIYSKKDREALRACQDTGLKFPEITTWIRANEKDFELVKEAGAVSAGTYEQLSNSRFTVEQTERGANPSRPRN